MKTRHTAGPWNYFDGYRTTWAIHAGKHPSHSHHPIAEIPRPDNDARGVGEADANARLIAAAPDMLAALERLSEAMKQGRYPELQGITCDAFAAIAKAKGEIWNP